MTIESLIVILLVGLIAGWLAGQFVKGGGFGLVGDINQFNCGAATTMAEFVNGLIAQLAPR
jgi:uncharacterized membrane protein YeaQ/YmgE (transglycosylase-associated protein family)